MSEEDIYKLALIRSKRQASTGNDDLDSAIRFYLEIGFVDGYNQGRKDAIDEVLGLLRKKPLELDWPLWEMTTDDVANSLEKKLQENKT